MSADSLYPWFRSCLELVDLRRQDRVLVVAPASPAELQAITDLAGRQGHVVCLEPELPRAEVFARIDAANLEVAHWQPAAPARLGAFDALVACPLVNPDRDAGAWADLARDNLRPGGRFVLDLPAPEMSEELTACWQQAGGDPEALAPLRGIDEAELTAALREHGLRRVQAVLATELLALDSPHDLADLFAPLLVAIEPLRAELGRALVARFGTTGPVQVLLRRSRVHGIR